MCHQLTSAKTAWDKSKCGKCAKEWHTKICKTSDNSFYNLKKYFLEHDVCSHSKHQIHVQTRWRQLDCDSFINMFCCFFVFFYKLKLCQIKKDWWQQSETVEFKRALWQYSELSRIFLGPLSGEIQWTS